MNNMLVQTKWNVLLPKLGLSYFLALRKFWGLSFLVSAIFVSALGDVYVQAMDRVYYGNLQQLQKARDDLSMQWGQLLLEQSTWSTQARVQGIAESRLNMLMPDQRTIVMVKE